MANSKPSTSSSSGSLKKLLAIGTALAAFLSRPEVQSVLSKVSKSTKDWAARINNGRRSKADTISRAVKERYGVGAMTRRLDDLRDAAADIKSLDESLANQLSEKERVLRARVQAAGKLPGDLRRKSLRTLDAAVFEMESALAEAIR